MPGGGDPGALSRRLPKRAFCPATPNPPSPTIVASAIQQDLADLPEHLVLVLDDYQVIEDLEVHSLMSALLRHPAEQLHLVIAGRRAPPWSVSRLRLDEQLTEIGLAELRFTEIETADFVGRVARTVVSDETCAEIHGRVEGWAV